MAQEMQTVVQTVAMQAPGKDQAFAYRPYVASEKPEAVHARLWGNPEAGLYALNYNGSDLIRIKTEHAGVRMHSDGDFQSQPLVQQFLLSPEETGVMVEITFVSPVPFWNVRPERGRDGQAILGQMGAPLLYGVNGLYLPDWDLLVSWHGAAQCSWEQAEVLQENGAYTADLHVKLGFTPLVILLRPHYFHEHLGYATHEPWKRRPKAQAITGWCTWEAYHDKVSQEDMDAAAMELEKLKPYGLSIIQLDDGYQQSMVPMPERPIRDSWLNTKQETFPQGHEGIVAASTSHGFTPGIWTNATLTSPNGPAEWYIHTADGAVLYGDWIQYVMQCTEEQLEEEIVSLYRTLREQGYTYFKLDSIRHLLYDGLQEAVRYGIITGEEARARHRAFLQAVRKGIGEDAYLLSCWGVLTSSIGICDAMRIATDASPRFSAYSMQIRETARWFFAQRVLFTLDPDHVCVRGELPWVESVLSLVSLTGGVFMISDPPGTYDAPRLERMRRTMPGLTTHTGEVGPLDYTSPACAFGFRDMTPEVLAGYVSGLTGQEENPFASLWATHFAVGHRIWTVMERCAVIPLPETKVPMSALGLREDRRYACYSFWEDRAWETADGTLALPALGLGESIVVAICDVTENGVFLVGSDRHVSMDAVSVKMSRKTAEGLSLTLQGIAGETVLYVFYARGRENLSIATDMHTTVESVDRDGAFFRVKVRFLTDQESSLQMGA